PFHGIIKRVSVGNVDEVSAAVKSREGRQGASFALRAEEQPQPLDQFGHCAALTRGLAFELCHHRVVDVEGRFHMAKHIIYIASRAVAASRRCCPIRSAQSARMASASCLSLSRL